MFIYIGLQLQAIPDIARYKELYKLMNRDVYKFEPTGGKLKEKNSKWLNDDYVKFIRFAENMIEKSGGKAGRT